MPLEMSSDAHSEVHGTGSVFVLHEQHADLDPHHTVTHTEHGLAYLVEGCIEMEQGQRLRADAGTVILVPAGIPHRSLGARDVEYWMVGFCPSCLELDEGQPLMRPFRRVRYGALPVIEVPRSRRRRLMRLFRELQEENERGARESPELTRCLLLLLLGEVTRAMPGDAEGAAEGSLVADALEFIQRRGLEPISLEDVAAAVFRTRAHVAATVKKATGYTVGEWIAAGRVSQAAARLAHTDDTLDDIARGVGWRDKTHFIRQFRKAYGTTPAAWRRSQRDRHRQS